LNEDQVPGPGGGETPDEDIATPIGVIESSETNGNGQDPPCITGTDNSLEVPALLLEICQETSSQHVVGPEQMMVDMVQLRTWSRKKRN
jgi:hypothetical protein